MLGLRPRFDLDEAAVRGAWLERSARAHPDRAADPADAEREAAALNDAKRTLEDPERRAAALLARLGAGPAQPERAEIPPSVLMEFLEVREALDEARAAGDRARVEALRGWAEERRRAHIDVVAALFADALREGPGDARSDAVRAIRRELAAWRYAERMLEQIDDL